VFRPTTPPAGRAAVLLNYVLRPAGFVGHCNVRLSLNVAGEFRTSKKYRLSAETSDLRTRTAPLGDVLICRMNASHHGSDEEVDLPMNGGQPSSSDSPISGGPGMNPSHHGSDEQVFGANQQVLRG
jgi:hypothetical protein